MSLVKGDKSISAGKLPDREAVRDHSPGLLGLGFCHKEFALKGRLNAMVFRHGSQGIHVHPFPSVAPSVSPLRRSAGFFVQLETNENIYYDNRRRDAWVDSEFCCGKGLHEESRDWRSA